MNQLKNTLEADATAQVVVLFRDYGVI